MRMIRKVDNDVFGFYFFRASKALFSCTLSDCSFWFSSPRYNLKEQDLASVVEEELGGLDFVAFLYLPPPPRDSLQESTLIYPACI